jgi:hypothetical protein
MRGGPGGGNEYANAPIGGGCDEVMHLLRSPVGDATVTSAATPNSVSVFSAGSNTGKSESLPIITATFMLYLPQKMYYYFGYPARKA